MTIDIRHWRHGTLALGLALFAATAPLAAAAETATTAVINAQAYETLPPGRTVLVRPLDDSDANLRLQADIEELLRGAGWRIAGEAPLVLTFETRDELGAWSDGGRRTILELESRGDSLGGDEQRARLNLFNSQQGALLNPGSDTGTQIVAPARIEVELTLDDQISGQRLWQGWGHADLGAADAQTQAAKLIGPLVGTMGQTVRRQTVDLP